MQHVHRPAPGKALQQKELSSNSTCREPRATNQLTRIVSVLWKQTSDRVHYCKNQVLLLWVDHWVVYKFVTLKYNFKKKISKHSVSYRFHEQIFLSKHWQSGANTKSSFQTSPVLSTHPCKQHSSWPIWRETSCTQYSTRYSYVAKNQPMRKKKVKWENFPNILLVVLYSQAYIDEFLAWHKLDIQCNILQYFDEFQLNAGSSLIFYSHRALASSDTRTCMSMGFVCILTLRLSKLYSRMLCDSKRQ